MFPETHFLSEAAAQNIFKRCTFSKFLWFKTSHKNILRTVLDVIFCHLWQTVSTKAMKAFTYITSAHLTEIFITIFAHSFFLGIIHMVLAIRTKCFFALRTTIIFIKFFKVFLLLVYSLYNPSFTVSLQNSGLVWIPSSSIYLLS